MSRRRRIREASSAALLSLSVFAAAEVVVLLMTAPLNLWLSSANPLLYGVTASVAALLPIAARLWSGMRGAATFVAVTAGVLLMPVPPLGVLIPVAIGLPMAVFDLVLGRSGHSSRTHITIAAACGGLTIWAMSFAVIDPMLFSPSCVFALLAIRVGAYILVGFLATAIAARLWQAGVG